MLEMGDLEGSLFGSEVRGSKPMLRTKGDEKGIL